MLCCATVHESECLAVECSAKHLRPGTLSHRRAAVNVVSGARSRSSAVDGKGPFATADRLWLEFSAVMQLLHAEKHTLLQRRASKLRKEVFRAKVRRLWTPSLRYSAPPPPLQCASACVCCVCIGRL